MRTVEILEAGGKWREASWSELHPGVVFRLFEDDGTPVDDGEVCRVVEEVRGPYRGETFRKLDGAPVEETEDNQVVMCESFELTYENLVIGHDHSAAHDSPYQLNRGK